MPCLGLEKSQCKSRDFGRSFICHCCLVAKSCPTLLQPRVVRQAPLSLGFSRQEYWSGFPFLSPGELPHSGIKPASPALAGVCFTTGPPRKPSKCISLALNSPWNDLRGNRWTLSETVQSLPPDPLAQVLLLFHQVRSQLKHSVLSVGLPENPGQV